jgi:hypothetical protein
MMHFLRTFPELSFEDLTLSYGRTSGPMRQTLFCENGNVVVLPTCSGFLSQQTNLSDSLLSWLLDLTSSNASVPKLVKKKRHGLSLGPNIEFRP